MVYFITISSFSLSLICSLDRPKVSSEGLRVRGLTGVTVLCP